MTEVDKCLLANQMCKSAFTMRDAGYFVPGVSSALSGQDAYNAFRQGRYLSGLGHSALALTGLIPGVGMGASLGKGLARTVPTFTKALSPAVKGLWKAPGLRTVAKYPGRVGIGGGIAGFGGDLYHQNKQQEIANNTRMMQGYMGTLKPNSSVLQNPINVKPFNMTSSNLNLPVGMMSSFLNRP